MIAKFPFSCFFSCYLDLLLVLVLFRLCLSNANSDGVVCLEGERQALLQFKRGLLDESDRLASWSIDGDSDCCKWDGIVCNNFTGHVHDIRLRGVDGQCITNYDGAYYREYEDTTKERLKGNLSSSLLSLKELRHLDLSCNDFGGIQVPSFIASFQNLRYLNLSSSEFAGSIPPQLGNLSELRVLSLARSFYFPGEPGSMMSMQWLSNLRMLHHLDLSSVDLSKVTDWFQVINTLPSLVHLRLSSCGLSIIHPHVPSLNITSLFSLELSGNMFNTLVPRWIFSTTSLVSLYLDNCRFYGPIPSSVDSFYNLTSLKLLHASGNNFMNSISVLKGLSAAGSNLLSLDVSSCDLSSVVLDSLHNLTSLQNLDLSDNQLTNLLPKSWGNLCNLRNLDLSANDYRNFTLTHLLERFIKCKSPRLESLVLKFVRLSGHLSDQLGQLTNLVDLRLQSNNIVGTIPASIGQLSSLRTLILFSNHISGPIPYSIGQLSSLEVFDINNNQVTGTIPDSFGHLASLEALDLSLNQLTGSLPDSLGQLSKLTQLDFSYNNLSGIVTEAHFAKHGRMVFLNGNGNKLILRPRIANWTPPFFQLQHLSLNSWVLGPQFPPWLQLQRQLLKLRIRNTRISSSMPEWFLRSFPHLVSLDMSKNHIQGTFPGIQAKLYVLDLSSNAFTGPLPNLSYVDRFVDLSNNSFEGSLNGFLCSNGVSSIEVLNLGNNHLSGVIPECWEKWSHLNFLNLENNNLSGRVPRTLSFASRLKTLNMNGNKLTGRLPASLIKLTDLEVLQLGGNELGGSIPKWIGQEFSSLKILDLRSNNFDGNIPRELCYLKHIQIFDLANNKLAGNIPKCFSNSGVLSGKEALWKDPFAFSQSNFGTEHSNSDSLVIKGREDSYNSILNLVVLIDLSVNNFDGHIPSELTSLKALQSLNLSRNQLTGRIPEKIGEMKALVSFDLSMNKLHGELPMSLSRLSFLTSFNVSHNNLTGRIPTSTQLQSLNESSFFDNKLCGVPLTNSCVRAEVPNTKLEEDDDSLGKDWGFIISIVVGFFVGFWIVFGPLIVSRSWRIAYFRLLSKVGYMVYDVMYKYCGILFSK